MRRLSGRQRGMSLIEVMMAGALLAVGAAATFSAWSTVTGIMEHQRRLTDATGVTRSQLEWLLSLPAGDPGLASGTRQLGAVNVFGSPDPNGYRVDHAVVGNKPGPGFIELTVVVRWTEKFGERQTTLTTYRER